MENITFDLGKRDGASYVSDGNEIHLLSFPNTFRRYSSWQHIYGPPNPSENIKFNVKCADGRVVTLSLANLISGPYKYLQVTAYFRDDNHGVGPIFLGVIFSSQTGDSSFSETVKLFYRFSEITANSCHGVVKLMSLSSVSPDLLGQDLLDEQYRLLATTVAINLHERRRFYKGGFTIGSNGENSHSLVRVESPKHVTGFKDYFVFSHVPKVSSFTRLDLRCSDDCCTFVDFDGSRFSRANTDKVLAYFCSDDHDNRVPLLIGFIKCSDDGDSGFYYRLHSIYEDYSRPSDRRWVKVYEPLGLRVRNPELSLKAIHSDNKFYIDTILNRYGPYNPLMDQLMMGFGICTILLAFTATGIWIYLNLETAMDTVNNLYRRF
ncbi:hypothetical protein TOT_010000520 [Theileria orientalis strain Shintoku]|uniref:Uncharacterized protein n=1 Tax=Theileria orientalis strain Shintoku TaxID=869250 RepID=J4CCA6_THEOR|nr:hypothetical protein TOT_010000520 [Theileria orientalis strain Shintoku]PVC54078.1 hypothetical protein MACL_00003322 [Theileria orientalis]BAM39057.1 hypothetical protein TOT_010000520 [Theileria orientalis strain Shintoku]|eukprot:XP_009689358.1 hypothetical protein TOT_010000520 [Theileria orientalis strain Shintoku]